MTGKALSELPSFRESLILRAVYSSAPGMSGFCELAVRWRKSQTELWNWVDEWGSECVLKLPKNAGHREIVEAMVGNDQVSATIDPGDVEIIRDKPPLGSLLALAWASEFDTQPQALLLAALPWAFLQSLNKTDLQVGGEKLRSLLDDLHGKIREQDLEIEDLLPIEEPASGSSSAIRATFRKAMARALRRRHSDELTANRERRAFERNLAPFKDQIQKIYDNYSRIRTPRRYPGGGPLPPAGLMQLRRYVDEFVLANGCMPTGVHTIPEGPDIFNSRSKAYDIDFDVMRKELPYVLTFRWSSERGTALWFWNDPKTKDASDTFESEAAAIAAWKEGRVTLHKQG